MNEDVHPSFFILDQISLGATLEDLKITKHLDECERCRRYVNGLKISAPLPPWLTKEKADRLSSRRPTLGFWRSWKPLWILFPTLAVTSIIFGVLTNRRSTIRSTNLMEITEKGGPEVSAFIKRENHVFQWDGRAPVLPNDHIRLQIIGAGYRYVSVTAITDDGKLGAELYSGILKSVGATQLPLGWLVDSTGARESIGILLSREPIALSKHRNVFNYTNRDGGVWGIRLNFLKIVH